MANTIPPTAETLTTGALGDAAPPTEIPEEYDLLPRIIPFFDRHLVYPLLDFQPNREDADLTRTKYELFRTTNMLDYIVSLWQEMNNSDDVPEELAKRKEEVMQRLQLFAEENAPMEEIINDDNIVSNLRSDKVANFKFLESQHGVTTKMVDTLYDFGRFQYSCGNYGEAARLLNDFRTLSTDNDKTATATWGKLVSDILTGNWAEVMLEIQKVQDSIDTKLFNNPLAQLQHRTWLIHWSLFPLFNYDAGRDTLCDLYFSPAFINTIQTNCPWILRYLATVVITNRNRSKNSGQYLKQLKDLTRIVRQEAYEYRDPVTDFIKALHVDFDFEEAQKKLIEADNILHGDFFTAQAAEGFVEAARHLISESYCKIHQRIDIK